MTAEHFDFCGRTGRSIRDILIEICKELYCGDYEVMLADLERLANQSGLDRVTEARIRKDIAFMHKHMMKEVLCA